MENYRSKSELFYNAELTDEEIEVIEDENEEVYKWLSILLGFVWVFSMFIL